MYSTPELPTAIGDIGACRYDGIEINLGELRAHGLETVDDELAAHDLDVFCVMGDWMESDEQVQRVADGAELAAALDAPFLALLPPRRGYTDDDTFAAWLDQIADAADDVGVTPILHHHGATHVERPEEIETWLDRGPDSLALLLDTAHYYPYDDIVEGIERFADDLAYVHLKDIDPPNEFADYVEGLTAADFNLDNVINYFRSFTDPGSGEINFVDILETLDTIGYDDPLTIEIENQIDDPLVHAKKNYDYYTTLTE